MRTSRPLSRRSCFALTLTLAAVPLVPATAQDADKEAFEASGRLHHPKEVHLEEVRQLTFGGENAEAYWSPDGEELIFQSTRPPFGCDQIFRIPAAGGEPILVSTGKGRTTCAFFTADGEHVLYSSTHEGSEACPAPPDRSQGYVWPLYDSFQVYRAKADGTELVALTSTDAYDAEATVCAKDGSIVFTSTRDGDLELYRMDADGGNVKRLTETPGYDGGAFFSPDCSKIVWRASRPQEGEELDDYRRLLDQGLVRPSRLEIWVADSDGGNARQITYLGAASFAPYFFPSGDRVIFSTNHGSSPREFDLWAVNVDGSDLERITYAPGFDGFPMFSPDGKYLAFGSNRNQGKPGETDVYVARWVDDPEDEGGEPAKETGADRVKDDIAWLAADERQGRGVGTEGLEAAGKWIAERFAEIGLEPAGEDEGYFHSFEVPVELEVLEGTGVAIGGKPLAEDAFRPAPFSASAKGLTAEAVTVGYGIKAPDLEVNDYEGADVEGKIAVVRRFTPTDGPFEETVNQRRYSDLRLKAFTAREQGAVGLVIVDLPLVGEGEEMAEEAPFPPLRVDGKGDAGIPVVHVSREAGAALFEGAPKISLDLALERRSEPAFNVVGKLPGKPEGKSDEKALLVGAHYDHLGLGGRGSLDPELKDEPRNGADDNASGVAVLLEIARHLTERQADLERPVYFVAFSGEESGLLGSTAFTREPTGGLDLEELTAMINLDMVGRLRNNRLTILGGDSAEEWEEIVPSLCAEAALGCSLGGDGYGPSDQTPFYAAGVPVLHFFTGTHDEYHKASDDLHLINAAGGARIASLGANLLASLSARPEELTLLSQPAPPPQGDRRSYGAYLGTIPDYAGPEDGGKGVLLAGAREGSPAADAGFERGDRLIGLGDTEIGDIHDFVFVLRSSKPGEATTAVVLRDGEEVVLPVTFGSRSGEP